MKHKTIFLTLVLVAATAGLQAQQTASAGRSAAAAEVAAKKRATEPPPFSRVALAGGISAMGVNMQAAVNANRYLNLRVSGNYFGYTLSNIKTNGMTATGNLDLATMGLSADIYPFPYHGFRLSPGVLFYNQNGASASIIASAGSSFTLNGTDYYSSATDPVTGSGSVGLHSTNPAFTMTTGWGNLISRRGGHWSVPFEIGAAFVGAPGVNLALTGGQVCTDPAGTIGCQNVTDDPTLKSDLAAQIAKYRSDLDPLKVYPILSIGVGYNFKIR